MYLHCSHQRSQFMTKMHLGDINQTYITVKTLASDLLKTTKLLCVRSKRMIWGLGGNPPCVFLLGFIMPCQVACWRFSALQWSRSGKMERSVVRGKQMQLLSLQAVSTSALVPLQPTHKEAPLTCWQGKDKER